MAARRQWAKTTRGSRLPGPQKSRLERAEVIPEPELPPGPELLAAGRLLARDWQVEPSAFLEEVGAASEADYKRAQMAAGRVMQHAQLGYRDPGKTRRAWAEIYEACLARGFRIDRYGICLDWSLGYPAAARAGRSKGTGLIPEGPEGFAALTAAAPVAPHFGDFVLGFPAAVENTQAALAAGSTAVGNLGQYFTFRLPQWQDDLAATEATVTALGLIAAQEVEVLVHSNLDDGFAAGFSDLACALGAAMIESHIVEDLIGARLGPCYGHHFSDPVTRLAFQRALARVSAVPGTMIYGNTVSYRGGPAENFASLGSYLLVDILGQRRHPSGHAVNAVPVMENERIPEVEEIIEAQLFAGRLIEQAEGLAPLVDLEAVAEQAEVLLTGGRRFREQVLAGLAEAGFAVEDPFELLLTLRRIGGRRLEALFGPGAEDPAAPQGRRPLVPATIYRELDDLAARHLAAVNAGARAALAEAGLSVVVASTDVHEHGKLLVERVFQGLGLEVIDGGVSSDPEALAAEAAARGADAVAVSTYNGVALRYLQELMAELRRRDLALPVLIGGRLNQVPEGSNSSLPVAVTEELQAAGAVVCPQIEAALPALLALAERKGDMT